MKIVVYFFYTVCTMKGVLAREGHHQLHCSEQGGLCDLQSNHNTGLVQVVALQVCKKLWDYVRVST